jgi:hypothetical protein
LLAVTNIHPLTEGVGESTKQEGGEKKEGNVTRECNRGPSDVNEEEGGG